jgi:hypothetical protein
VLVAGPSFFKKRVHKAGCPLEVDPIMVVGDEAEEKGVCRPPNGRSLYIVMMAGFLLKTWIPAIYLY